MITITTQTQSEIICTTMEELVPSNSLYRKIDACIDFTFIYDEVKEYYSENNGRPSLDPVVLFKLVFIMSLDGIKSKRHHTFQPSARTMSDASKTAMCLNAFSSR